MQPIISPVTTVLREQHDETKENGHEDMNEDNMFQDDKQDDGTSFYRRSSTHESNHDDMKRYSEDNSSVQVAIRIRPLLTNEDQHESLQLFASSLSSSSSSSTFLEDTNSRFMKSKSLSESTMATVPESSMSYSDVFHQNYQMLQVGEGDMAPAFTFDHVFPSTAGQEQVYNTCVTPLVESCLEGYNATVLAYGQTGSGKTHTILGSLGEKADDDNDDDDDHRDHDTAYGEEIEDDQDEGVIPRALKDIFRGLEELQKNSLMAAQQKDQQDIKVDVSSSSPAAPAPSAPHGTKPFEFCIKIQFVELYGEEIRDLLVDFTQEEGGGNVSHDGRPKMRKVKTSGDLYATPRAKITIRDGKVGEGAELIGVERFEVKSAREAMNYLRMGLAKRVVGKTAMNVHSSRSHAIFTAVVHQTVRRYLAGTGGGGGGGGGQSNTRTVGEKLQVEMKTSKMHFVDLCGSERVKRAQTAGKRLKEGIDINKGLLALGNVISALGKSGPKAHVPYRDSKLTRILKGSLGGNHKTLMIACVSPSLSNINETTNTLRYANRAKNIKNNAKINVDPQYQVVHELRDQVAALAAELLKMRSNKSYDEDDFPFSIEFLNELIRGGDGSVWRKREGLQRSASMNINTQLRPSTSPAMSVVTPDRTIGHDAFGNPDSRKINMGFMTQVEAFQEDDTEWDANSAEDPELAKNIESYDFALATLRQSVSQKMARHVQEPSKPFDIITTTLERDEDHEQRHDEFRAHLYDEIDGKDDEAARSSPPPSPPSALKKIRNIDELYDFLNNNTYVDENGKIVDDEGTVVSEVVQSHVLKLEEAISQKEKILKEMETSHEIFELMKSDNIEKLAEIETELQLYRKERESLSSVHSLLDEE